MICRMTTATVWNTQLVSSPVARPSRGVSLLALVEQLLIVNPVKVWVH